MALQRSRHHDLPKDAVVLTETEALAYQTNILNKWDNRKDVYVAHIIPLFSILPELF